MAVCAMHSSLLDQAIAYGQGSVNKAQMSMHMLGSMAQDDLFPFIKSAFAKHNGKEIFLTIEKLAEQSPDFHQVLEELIRILHKIAMTQVVPDAMTTEDQIVELCNDEFTPEDVQIYYQIALLGRRDLGLTPSPQQGFEMTMLRMLAFTANSPRSENISPPPCAD